MAGEILAGVKGGLNDFWEGVGMGSIRFLWERQMAHNGGHWRYSSHSRPIPL